MTRHASIRKRVPPGICLGPVNTKTEPVPKGQVESSPAIYRRVWEKSDARPSGTLDHFPPPALTQFRLIRPYGTSFGLGKSPTINCRAFCSLFETFLNPFLPRLADSILVLNTASSANAHISPKGARYPGRCPGLGLDRPVGAENMRNYLWRHV